MTLKRLLSPDSCLTIPGVFDPLSALVAESAGATCLYMTGYGVSASLLGKPDAGLVSYREMEDRVRAICAVTNSPLIADGDTGFGGLANVQQAILGYEAAGASAIQIEDQEYPKRCGHTKNRRVIPSDDMVKKIHIAKQTRNNDEFLLVARTDARTEHGLDEALRRAEAYVSAGADILFVESPESIEEMQAICETFPEVPKLANMVGGGKTPILSQQELSRIGYQIAIHPIYGLGAAVTAMGQAVSDLLRDGKPNEDVAAIDELNTLVNFDAIWELDRE